VVNRFWRWVRLREGRTIYRAELEIYHADGTPVKITVESAHAEYASAVANGLRKHYGKNVKKVNPLQTLRI